MATPTVAQVPIQQFLDANALPLAGGLLYTYAAGTSTPQTVWQDVGLSVSWTNPIVLGSDGRVPGEIFPPTSPAIKYVLKTNGGVTVWTADNVIAAAGAS